MMVRLGLVAGLLLAATAVAAQPGPPIRRVEHPGGGTSVVVAGVSLTCPTSAGGMVWWMVTPPSAGPAGFNQSRGGVSWTPGPVPHIFLRADLFGTLLPAVQLYIALHECAHFHLPAHLKGELNADCGTVRTLLANRWMTESDLEFVRRKLGAPRDVADWGHPSSHIHFENIPRCLSGR
jgi:hypothetical protein